MLASAGDILDNAVDDDKFTLPPHGRCCSHTLNLLATTDAANALKLDQSYKRIHNQAMAKCSALWNLTSRSTKAADTAFDTLGFRFLVPTVVRWNSHYNAVRQVLKADGKLNALCTALKLPVFLPNDVSFLKEYVSLMGPVSTALNILQGEMNCHLGYVLPSVTVLRAKILGARTKFAGPLKQALLAGLDKRFHKYFEQEEFLLAAISHPRFKTSWTEENGNIKKRCIQLLENAVAAELSSRSDNGNGPSGSGASGTSTGTGGAHFDANDCPVTEDDFFDFEFGVTNDRVDGDSVATYLHDSDKSVNMLHRHPAVLKVFVKYNSVIPSSAPVERLFSAGSILLTTRRNRLSDDTFERLLLLKQNNNFVEYK